MPIRRNLTINLEVFHLVYFRNGCVLSGSSLCDGPIHRPEQSYRVWCVKLLSRALNSETAQTGVRVLRHTKREREGGRGREPEREKKKK
jgi:hypothetical protein